MNILHKSKSKKNFPTVKDFDIVQLLESQHYKISPKHFNKSSTKKTVINLSAKPLESSKTVTASFYQNGLGREEKNKMVPYLEKSNYLGESTQNETRKSVSSLDEYVNAAYKPHIKISLIKKGCKIKPLELSKNKMVENNDKLEEKNMRNSDRKGFFMTSYNQNFENAKNTLFPLGNYNSTSTIPKANCHIILPELQSPTIKLKRPLILMEKFRKISDNMHRSPQSQKIPERTTKYTTKLLDSNIIPSQIKNKYKTDIFEYIRVTELIMKSKIIPFSFSHNFNPINK